MLDALKSLLPRRRYVVLFADRLVYYEELTVHLPSQPLRPPVTVNEFNTVTAAVAPIAEDAPRMPSRKGGSGVGFGSGKLGSGKLGSGHGSDTRRKAGGKRRPAKGLQPGDVLTEVDGVRCGVCEREGGGGERQGEGVCVCEGERTRAACERVKNVCVRMRERGGWLRGG